MSSLPSFITSIARIKKDLDYSLVEGFPNSLEFSTSKLFKITSNIQPSLYITSTKKRENIEKYLESILDFLYKENKDTIISKS